MNRLMLCALFLGAGVLGAQTSDPVIVKDPSLATVLSFLLPGGGQMYAGKTGKGGAILMTGLIAGGGSAALYSSSQCVKDGGGQCSAKGLLTAGAAVAIASWLYGIGSAANDARQYNDEHAGQRASTLPCLSRDQAEVDGENMAVRVYSTNADGGCTEHRCNLRGAGVTMRQNDAIKACHTEASAKAKP